MSFREEVTGWPYETAGFSFRLSRRKLVSVGCLAFAVVVPPARMRGSSGACSMPSTVQSTTMPVPARAVNPSSDARSS